MWNVKNILNPNFLAYRIRGLFMLCLIGICANWGSICAQSTFVPLDNPTHEYIDRFEIKSGAISDYLHSSVKPYTRLSVVLEAEDADEKPVAFGIKDRVNQYYIYKDNSEWTEWGLVESKKPFLKHFYKYQADLIYVKEFSDFTLKVNPILHFEMGRDLEGDGFRYVNRRGAEMRGMISNKLGFYSMLTDNQLAFSQDVSDRSNRLGAVPGEGRYKPFTSMIGDELFAPGFDFFTAKGYLTFDPIDRVRITFGHDSNFIGNGIRSLFLSNNSGNYFFLKLNAQVWKINYQSLFMELTSQFDPGADELLPKKYSSMHHLSMNVTKWLNIGLFESVVYGRDNGFELQYLNPLIFYRVVEYHLGSPDNVILGMDYKINFLKRFQIYGQFLLDEFSFSQIRDASGWWGNKVGVQTGFKYIDVANVSNLDLQLEANLVRPYTYSHFSEEANYTHYNQAIAHPFGANFLELLAAVKYKPHKAVDVRLDLMYTQLGADIDTINYGSNIFRDNSAVANYRPTGNTLLQGNKTNVLLSSLTISWMAKHNLYFDANFRYRKQTEDINPSQTNIYGSLAMRLNIGRKRLLF